MVTPSGEAAQMPASATSKHGLDREAPAALLTVRTGPECPEGNLRELTFWLPTGPSTTGDRQARAARAGSGQSWPQRRHHLPNCKQA